MSLTGNFARIIMVAGHGANVVNNSHASGLHCGAGGGYLGEVNARRLAALLNDPAVRKGLNAKGILIHADTLFLGGLHDTKTDAVMIYADDHPSAAHVGDIDQIKHWLAATGSVTRGERALRLPRATGEETITKRSSDGFDRDQGFDLIVRANEEG